MRSNKKKIKQEFFHLQMKIILEKKAKNGNLFICKFIVKKKNNLIPKRTFLNQEIYFNSFIVLI